MPRSSPGLNCGSRGNLPVTKSGLKLSQRGVLVTLFGPDPYSDRTLLRVWEQAGKAPLPALKTPETSIEATASTTASTADPS